MHQKWLYNTTGYTSIQSKPFEENMQNRSQFSTPECFLSFKWSTTSKNLRKDFMQLERKENAILEIVNYKGLVG